MKIRTKNSKLNVNKLSISVSNRTGSLFSEDGAFLVYVKRGVLEHVSEHGTDLILAGDYFHFYGSNGTLRSLSKNDDTELVICRISDGLISDIYKDVPKIRDTLTGFSLLADGDGLARLLFERIAQEYAASDPWAVELICGLIFTLTVTLKQQDRLSAVSYIKEKVMERYGEEIRLSDIASQLGYSLTYTSLTFKRCTGESFRDYLARVRNERACDLLRFTDMTVAEISSAIGYSDAGFFYRSFKRMLGMTPNAYRESKVN